MLQTHTTRLSRDLQDRLHPDFVANEQSYLGMRDSLIRQYKGQWIAFHGGKVVAAGLNLMEVMEKASRTGGHPYIALVGAEDTVIFRARRAVFVYDQSYQPFALPRVVNPVSPHLTPAEVPSISEDRIWQIQKSYPKSA